MTPRWLHPAIWSVTSLVIAAAVVGHCVIWITYVTDESMAVEDFLMEDMELKIFTLNSSEHLDVAGSPSAVSEAPLQGSEIVDRGHIGSDIMLPHHRAHELGYWDHHYAGSDYALQGDMKLYSLRAPSQLIVMYLVYFVPLFVIGVAGWISQHWPASTPRVWMNNSWLVAVFSRSVRPVAFFAHCFGGLAFAELVFLVLFFAPKAAHLAWFVGIAKDQWRVGLDSLYMLTGVTETQYWVERLGMWFSVDFQIMAPFLFAFTAQDSLVHSYLGVSFATTRKWHRWLGTWILFDVLLHGALYQFLLLSDESSLWGRLHRQLAYHHGVSVLGGVISWLCAIVMLVALVPLAAMKTSGWKWVWNRVHVGAAVVVVVFGIVHSRKVWVSLAPGIVLYGIDLAHRWLQASRTASASFSLSASSQVLSAVVPLEEGVKYPDGGHVWLGIPTVKGQVYHPFVVASSAADPAWASSMLLHCKSSDPWAHKIVEGLQEAKYQKLPVRVQGPFGGHAMSRVELHATRKLLVFSGGFGITTVLPMLQRLALHRERRLSEADDTPQIKVFHSARSIDELILVAPLLDHPAIFDIHLHYTGNPHDLRILPHLHTLPVPVPLPNTTPTAPAALNVRSPLPPPVTNSLSIISPKSRGGVSAVASDRSMVVETDPLPRSSQPSCAENTEAMSSSTATAGRSLTSLASAPANLQSTPQVPPQYYTRGLSAPSLGMTTVSIPRVPAPGQPGPLGEATEGKTSRGLQGADRANYVQVEPSGTMDHRLTSMHGKWGSLFVWVGTWVLSFGILLIGELWYNASAAAQAGMLDGAARDDRRFKMVAYNLLSLALAAPTVPLLLLLLSHFPLLCRRPHTRSPAPPKGKQYGRGRGLRIGSSDSSGRRSRWSRSSSSGAVLPINAPRYPLMHQHQSHEGFPIVIMPTVPAHKLLPNILSLSDAHAPTRISSGHRQPSSKASSPLFNPMHSFDQLGKSGFCYAASDSVACVAPLKDPRSFKHSVQSSPVIVMHQRTQQTTQTTSQEASFLSGHSTSKQLLASMHASLGQSVAIQADRSDSLWGTHFTSQMPSADIYEMGTHQPSRTISDSSYSGSFSRVFSPPRHLYNAWLHGCSAAEFLAVLEKEEPDHARSEWLECVVRVATEFGVGPSPTPQSFSPPPPPPKAINQGTSTNISVPRATGRQVVSVCKPPTGRKPIRTTPPGSGHQGSYGGYSVGTCVTRIQDVHDHVSLPLPTSELLSGGARSDTQEPTMQSMLVTAPPATAAASSAQTTHIRTQSSHTSAYKTAVDTGSSMQSGGSAPYTDQAGHELPGGLHVSTSAFQAEIPRSPSVLSDAVQALRSGHAEMEPSGIQTRSFRSSSERMQSDALQRVHATHASRESAAVSTYTSQAASSGCEDAAVALLRGEPPCSRSSGKMPSDPARSMHTSLHHAPLVSSAASDSGHTVPLPGQHASSSAAAIGLSTNFELDEPQHFQPRELQRGLQSFAIEGLADTDATISMSSSRAGGSTEDALSFLPSAEAEHALGSAPTFEPWVPVLQPAPEIMHGSHALSVGARENRSSSLSSFKSALQPSDELAQSGAATSGAATSGGAAKELGSPDSSPKGETSQILQTVQTATGTVTRMHARAPKTWPQIVDPELSHEMQRVHAYPPFSPRSAGSQAGGGDRSVSLVLSPNVYMGPHSTGGTGSQSLGGSATTLPFPHTHDSSGSNGTGTQGSITHALTYTLSPLSAGESGTVSLGLPHNLTPSSGSQSVGLGGTAGPLPQRRRQESTGTQGSITHALHAMSPAKEGDGDRSVSLTFSAGVQSTGSHSSAVARPLPLSQHHTSTTHDIFRSTKEHEREVNAHGESQHDHSHEDISTVLCNHPPLVPESSGTNEGGSVSLALYSGAPRGRTSSGGASTPHSTTQEHFQYRDPDHNSPARLPRRLLRSREPPGPISEGLNSQYQHEYQSLPASAHVPLQGSKLQSMMPNHQPGAVCEGIDIPPASSAGSGPMSNSANTLVNVLPSPMQSPSNTHTPSVADASHASLSQQVFSGDPTPSTSSPPPSNSQYLQGLLLSPSMHSSSGSKRSVTAPGPTELQRDLSRDATVGSTLAPTVARSEPYGAPQSKSSKSIDAHSTVQSITAGQSRDSWDPDTGSVPQNTSSSGSAGRTQRIAVPAAGLASTSALGRWVWATSSTSHGSQHGASANIPSTAGHSTNGMEVPPSEAYMASEDSDFEGSAGSVGFAGATSHANGSGSERTSDAHSILSLTLGPTPTLAQPSYPSVSSASPQPSLQFSSAFATVPTPRAIGIDHSEGLMHAFHAFGAPPSATAAAQSTALQPSSPQSPQNPTATSTSMHPTPTWNPNQPSQSPHSAHSGTVGSVSVSTYTTQTDRDHTVDWTVDGASREMSPLAPPHLSYDGSDRMRAAPDSLGSTGEALGTEPGSATTFIPSGQASFETRDSDEQVATASIPPSSAASETLSALDLAVGRRLSQVHHMSGDMGTRLGSIPLSTVRNSPELHTAPFWPAPEPPLHPNPHYNPTPVPQAPEAEPCASGSMHEEHAISMPGAAAVLSGSPSHYDSVIGLLQTRASSVHTAGHNESTADASDGLQRSASTIANEGNPMRGYMPVQLLSVPIATPDSVISTERSAIHHPVDHLHGKEKAKAKKEAKRKARLLQARSTSRDKEGGSTDVPRQESSTTDHGYSTMSRLRSGRSRMQGGGSTEMTSPCITDSVESVGLAAAMDLAEEAGTGQHQKIRVQRSAQELHQHLEKLSAFAHHPIASQLTASPRAVRQTVSPGGVVIIHDYSEDEDEAAAAPSATPEREEDIEIAREGGMHVKGGDEGVYIASTHVNYYGEYEESAGVPGGAAQVLVDCSGPESVFIRSTKPNSLPVEIHLGRPDIAATVNAAFEGVDLQEAVNVWSAGPASLNLAVQVATSALPLRANMHVLTTTYNV